MIRSVFCDDNALVSFVVSSSLPVALLKGEMGDGFGNESGTVNRCSAGWKCKNLTSRSQLITPRSRTLRDLDENRDYS